MPLSSVLGSYKGLGVPLFGESRILQDSTKDIITLEHSSANAGRFVTFRDSLSSGNSVGGVSTKATSDLSWFNADGEFVGSVVAKQTQVAITGATTLTALTTANAYRLNVISTQAASSVFITLPSSGSCEVGMWIEILHNSTAGGVLHFMTTGSNAGGEIHAHIDSSATILSTGAVSNVSTGPMWWKFMCVSTVGPIWALSNLMSQVTNSTVAGLQTIAAATTA